MPVLQHYNILNVMELLRELVELNPKNTIFQEKNIEDHPVSKLKLLFDGVKSEAFKNDDDAAKVIYNREGGYPTYQRLKSRLIDKLIDQLITSTHKSDNFSSYQHAYTNCHRNWAVIKLLYTKGARNSAIAIAERTMGYAKKYELTDIVFLISRELRNHYALISYNKYKMDKYTEDFNKSLVLYECENEAEKYYSEIHYISLASRGTIDEKIQEKCENYVLRLREMLEEHESYRLLFMAYMTLSLRYQYAHDTENMLRINTEAVSVFENRPVTTQVALFNFNLRKMICHIQLGHFEESDAIAIGYLDSMRKGTYNWYYILFYYFTSLMHRKQYEKAWDTLYLGMRYKNFKTLATNLQDIFKVNEAYLRFLLEIDQIDEERINANKRSFKIFKFLNEMPLFSKDKRGINISILIIHILFLLQQKKYNKIIDRVDALRQYTHRYLRKDDTYRSNCFIQMLLQVSRADFNRIRAERYAKPYREKLSLVPMNLANQGLEVEIIPYEDLWEMVLDLL